MISVLFLHSYRLFFYVFIIKICIFATEKQNGNIKLKT